MKNYKKGWLYAWSKSVRQFWEIKKNHFNKIVEHSLEQAIGNPNIVPEKQEGQKVIAKISKYSIKTWIIINLFLRDPDFKTQTPAFQSTEKFCTLRPKMTEVKYSLSNKYTIFNF